MSRYQVVGCCRQHFNTCKDGWGHSQVVSAWGSWRSGTSGALIGALLEVHWILRGEQSKGRSHVQEQRLAGHPMPHLLSGTCLAWGYGSVTRPTQSKQLRRQCEVHCGNGQLGSVLRLSTCVGLVPVCWLLVCRCLTFQHSPRAMDLPRLHKFAKSVTRTMDR